MCQMTAARGLVSLCDHRRCRRIAHAAPRQCAASRFIPTYTPSSAPQYCTLTKEQLVKFAFDIVDTDKSGALSMEELRNLIKMVYGRKGLDSKAGVILDKMDKDHDDRVTLAEFTKVALTNQSL